VYEDTLTKWNHPKSPLSRKNSYNTSSTVYFSLIDAANVIIIFHVFRTSEKSLLESIAKEGKITDDTDAKLKTVVTNFLASFSA